MLTGKKREMIIIVIWEGGKEGAKGHIQVGGQSNQIVLKGEQNVLIWGF